MRDTNYYKYVAHENYSLTAEPTEQLTAAPSFDGSRLIPIAILQPNVPDETVLIAVFSALSGILVLTFLVYYRSRVVYTAIMKRKLDSSFGLAYTLDNV